MPVGIVTFLFSDIVGSTRRWRVDASMASMLARHDALARSAIERAGRTLGETQATVSSSIRAVTAAIEVQRLPGTEGARRRRVRDVDGIRRGMWDLADWEIEAQERVAESRDGWSDG